MSNPSEAVLAQVQERLAAIQSKLLEQDPLLPIHLAAIHQTLIQYEELAHLLSDAEISVLVQGQKKHMGVSLVSQAATKKAGPKAVPKGQTISDLL